MTATDYDFIRKLLRQRSGLSLSAEKYYLVESRLMPIRATARLRRPAGTDAASARRHR